MRNGGLIGLVLFGLLTLRQVVTYGREWHFGKYGMPATLLAADGRHYLDGSEIDEGSLALARSGFEEPLELGMVTVLAGCVVVYIHKSHTLSQKQKKVDLLKALLARAEACEQAGRLQEADEAMQRVRRIMAADKDYQPRRRAPP